MEYGIKRMSSFMLKGYYMAHLRHFWFVHLFIANKN